MNSAGLAIFRVFAIAMIVFAHVMFNGNLPPSWNSDYHDFDLDTMTLARWAVPFFFIASGWLQGKKLVQNPENARRQALKAAGRIWIIWLFWCAFYAVETPLSRTGLTWALPRDALHYWEQLLRDPLATLLMGTHSHLWFLSSLALTLMMYAALPAALRNSKWRPFLILGAILYIVGLLGGAYEHTGIGLTLPVVNTRNGVFFSTLFYAIGMELRNHPWKLPSPGVLCLAVVISACLMRLEFSLIEHLSAPRRDGWYIDYCVASVPFGLAITLLALSLPEKWNIKGLAGQGRYVLGIYCIHPAFIDLLRRFSIWLPPLLWIFVLTAVVLALSLASVQWLSKTPARRFVST